MTQWFEENLHDKAGFRQALRIKKTLFEDRSEHQHLVLFENDRFGRVLTLDGVVQTTEGDEFAYHEMLAHVPLVAHGAARDVLIIGGGDGGTAREVLRHDVGHVTMVEIDESVVAFSRQYLPGLSAGAFDDRRLDLVIADGAKFVAETAKRYDVVMIDSTDPIGPGEVLFTAEFYGHCKRCLKHGGVIVTQSGVPFVQPGELTATTRRLAAHFADAGCYLTVVPTYAGGFMALGWGSDDTALRGQGIDVLEARWARVAAETRYYSPAIHHAAFALPPFIARLVESG